LYDALSQCNDLDGLDSICSELLYLGFASTLDGDETDEIVDYWYHFYPPARVTNVTALHVLWENHKPLSSLEYSWVTRPVMIIQGTNKEQPREIFPVLNQDFIDSLSHVPGGLQIVTIENASYCLSIPRRTARKVDETVANFIKNFDRAGYPSLSLPTDRLDRFRLALEKVAQLGPHPDIALRNPLSAFSFSRVTPAEAKANFETIILPHMEAEKRGFKPEGAVRPFSERAYDRRPRAPSVVSLTEEVHITEEFV